MKERNRTGREARGSAGGLCERVKGKTWASKSEKDWPRTGKGQWRGSLPLGFPIVMIRGGYENRFLKKRTAKGEKGGTRERQ